MTQVMELERKVDAVASRAELAQYQRRFVELNDQVSTLNSYHLRNNTSTNLRAIKIKVKIFAVPLILSQLSRAELAQYQRRFLELNDQVYTLKFNT